MPKSFLSDDVTITSGRQRNAFWPIFERVTATKSKIGALPFTRSTSNFQGLFARKLNSKSGKWEKTYIRAVTKTDRGKIFQNKVKEKKDWVATTSRGPRLVLIYLSRYLDQETAKGPFRSSSQTSTCYYQSNHSKLEAIPLSALPKDTTGELAGLSLH